MHGKIAVKKFTALSLAFTFAAALFAAPHSPSAQSAGETAGNPPSVLDRIREKIKEKNSSEDRARSWFDNLDTNKDNEITKKELFEGLRTRFERLDRNNDRHLSKEEYLRVARDRPTGERRFGELDANADGRLSLPEFASPADWRFDRIDRNLDGRINRAEAAPLFDRPVGDPLPQAAGECFYVNRQIVRVKDEVAEAFKKRGYPKADCSWTPDTTEQEKSKKF